MQQHLYVRNGKGVTKEDVDLYNEISEKAAKALPEV